MNPIRTIVLAAAAAVMAANAMAQVPSPTTTDEARALVAKAGAEFAAQRAFEPPVLEPVPPGDYRAAARNEVRFARFVDFHQSLQAHIDGARSAPIKVDSETSARRELSRQRGERDMDRCAAYLKASPTAWLIHQEVLQELGPLALR